MKNKFILFIVLSVFVVSCKPELDSFQPARGNADFSKYVSLGNSLTAGLMDNEVFRSSQLNSYPNILAQQFALAGGGEFKQPLMSDDIGFGRRLVLNINPARNCDGSINTNEAPSLSPIPLALIDPKMPDSYNLSNQPSLAQSNNLGVPGARSFHLLAEGYGSMNPYYGRFAADPAGGTILGQAMMQNPTFFSLWIGNNDILEYALDGGEGRPITSDEMFSAAIGGLIATLTSNGAKGVVMNIPDITALPFFKYIQYNMLVLDDDQAQMLTAAYSALGIKFNKGMNPFIIADAIRPGGMRQIKENEMIVLSIPQDSLKCAGWGSLKPIPEKYVLDETEIGNIIQATQRFNDIIKTAAESKDLAFVDANAIFKSALSGWVYDGMKFNLTFVTGGIFSLDGVHLTARGNALTANFIIDAINAKYNSSIPKVDINNYPGIIFP